MQPEAKILILTQTSGVTTVDNVSTLISGFEKVLLTVSQSIGTQNEASVTSKVTLQVRDYTSTDDGDTAWTTIVGTATSDPVAGTLAAAASAANAVTEYTFGLSRGALKNAKRLQVKLDHNRTGTAGVTKLSAVGLLPHAGAAADLVS